MTEEEIPYTTDELTDEQIRSLSLPDQIRYAVYNGRHTITEISEITSHDESWTRQMINDLTLEGSLVRDSDSDDVLLPEDERPPEPEDAEEANDGVDSGESDPEPPEDGSAETEEPPNPEKADVDGTTGGGEAAQTALLDAAETDGGAVAGDAVEGDVTPDPEDVVSAREKNDGLLPVDRDYDWHAESLDPRNVEEYISSDGEYEDAKREIDSRRQTGKYPRFRICGPTGCGKTSMPENIAIEVDESTDKAVPVFEIQCHDGLRPSNLLGMPTYVGEETWWTDGPLTKALLASRDPEVEQAFLILDEVNRTTARTLGVVMSALDHQCRVTLNARGGEVVEGDPHDLIVFATMNEGTGYVVNDLDTAQIRRFGNTFYTDYLGMSDVDREAEVVEERTPVSLGVAREMVEAANQIREKAQDDSSALKMGVPTSTMLDWARTAWAYRNTTTESGPLVKAGERSVINPFFRGDSATRSTVETIIESHLEGMPVDHEGDAKPLESIDGVGTAKAEALRDAGIETVGDVRDASEEEIAECDGLGRSIAARIKADVGTGEAGVDVSEDAHLVCQNCGWNQNVEDAGNEVVTMMECPSCEGTLKPEEL